MFGFSMLFGVVVIGIGLVVGISFGMFIGWWLCFELDVW